MFSLTYILLYLGIRKPEDESKGSLEKILNTKGRLFDIWGKRKRFEVWE